MITDPVNVRLDINSVPNTSGPVLLIVLTHVDLKITVSHRGVEGGL